MWGILQIVCSIGVLVCSILVGVQAIKRQQIPMGILCIICGIVALVYGWMKSNEWGIKNLMIIFTVLVVLNLLFAGLNAATAASAVNTGQY